MCCFFSLIQISIWLSEYNWEPSDHPWNTLVLSLMLHRQRRTFPYGLQLVFTIQSFAFSPLIPLFLPFPLATVSLILLFVLAIVISRVCRRSNICIIGDDIFAAGTGCSLNRNISRQITIRYVRKMLRACLLISFLFFAICHSLWIVFFYTCAIRYRLAFFVVCNSSNYLILIFDPRTKQ